MTNLAKAGGAFVLLGIVAGCRPAPVPTALDAATRAAIVDTVRAVSNAMIVAMRGRQIDSVPVFADQDLKAGRDPGLARAVAALRSDR